MHDQLALDTGDLDVLERDLQGDPIRFGVRWRAGFAKNLYGLAQPVQNIVGGLVSCAQPGAASGLTLTWLASLSTTFDSVIAWCQNFGLVFI